MRVKAHDQRAWERLVEFCAPLVYAWCRRAGLQEADAHDVAQEVLRAVARGIEAFRRDRAGDSFRAWLREITRNKIRDHARTLRAKGQGVGGSDHQQMIDQVADYDFEDTDNPQQLAAETKALYQRAVELIRGEFSESDWNAFWLVVVEAYSPADAAKELGLSVNSVYLAKSRILHRVRAEFADLLEEPEDNESPDAVEENQ